MITMKPSRSLRPDGRRRAPSQSGPAPFVTSRGMFDRLESRARSVKRDAHVLYLAARDPRVPWYTKLLALAVAAYAASPIDLIPDFIPVIGYVDDLIIVLLGIGLVVKLIPPEIMAEHRELAVAAQDRLVSKSAALVIVGLWILAITVAGWLLHCWMEPT
jgi:uncharacterized membrane protein YkvA (DUF1232 family)